MPQGVHVSPYRGRAGSPARTGLFIRQYLLEHGEDHPSEIHRAYRAEMERLGKRIGTFGSFMRYFHLLVQLGYLEFAGREEEMQFPGQPVKPALLQIRNHDQRRVVNGVVRFYGLTPEGKAEPPHQAWYNPYGVWRRLREEGLI